VNSIFYFILFFLLILLISFGNYCCCLNLAGLFSACFRCVVLDAKDVEDRYVLSVHSKKHVDLIRNISSKQFDSRRNRIASKFNSIYLNEGSSEAAFLSAGSVIEVVMLCFHSFSR
jgi:hypothetical protein